MKFHLHICHFSEQGIGVPEVSHNGKAFYRNKGLNIQKMFVNFVGYYVAINSYRDPLAYVFKGNAHVIPFLKIEELSNK